MSHLFDSTLKTLGYLLSLPERTIRSMAAMVSGTTALLTETLFPEALRGTTFYRIFIGDVQRFVIQQVAQVQREQAAAAPAEPPPGDYVQRKMIGSALDTAGLFAMHLSPLWVFAIAGDAAAGGSVFLDRLVRQLKKNQVVPEDAQVAGVADLLGVIQDTSRKSVAALDTPPLSRAELSKMVDDMVGGYRQVFSKTVDLLPRAETLWQQMVNIANRENISIEKLSGILTVDVASWAKKSVGAVLAVGQTGSELFGEKILDGYARTLEAVSKEGTTKYLNQHMAPFVEAATGHFSPGRKTWTESLLGLREDQPTAAAQPPSPAGPCPTQEPAASEPAPPSSSSLDQSA